MGPVLVTWPSLDTQADHPINKLTEAVRQTVLRDPLLNEDQASEVLGVKPGTLQVWRSTKRYPLNYVKVGRNVRYRLSDIEAFLKRQTVNR